MDARDELSLRSQIIIFLIVLVAIFSRRPSLFLHAQFYAEDGTVWYAQAYNGGWLHSLTLPRGGYLNTLQRLFTGVALWFPFRYAPLVAALSGLLIQALPVPILLSARCRSWAPLSTRLFFAFIYVALPNSSEIHVVLTNAQWHLLLALLLLAFGETPRSWKGRVVEVVIFLIAGFSGPFCILLIPTVLLYWWVRREHWNLVQASLMSIGAFVQACELLFGPPREHAALGATVPKLLRMLGGEIVGCGLRGEHNYALSESMPIIFGAVLILLAIYGYCLRRAQLALKFFIGFCILLLAVSLRSPLFGWGTKPQWDLLLSDTISRYWYFPTLAFLWCALWCALYAKARSFRILGTVLILIFLAGLRYDWLFRPFPDEHFKASAVMLQNASPGTQVEIPIVPEGWKMVLIKKDP